MNELRCGKCFKVIKRQKTSFFFFLLIVETFSFKNFLARKIKFNTILIEFKTSLKSLKFPARELSTSNFLSCSVKRKRRGELKNAFKKMCVDIETEAIRRKREEKLCMQGETFAEKNAYLRQ